MSLSPDHCPNCWLWFRHPEHRDVLAPLMWPRHARFGLEKPAGYPARPKRVRKPACPDRGPPTGETVPCQTCKGTVKMKVFSCPVHGRSTVGRDGECVALA